MEPPAERISVGALIAPLCVMAPPVVRLSEPPTDAPDTTTSVPSRNVAEPGVCTFSVPKTLPEYWRSIPAPADRINVGALIAPVWATLPPAVIINVLQAVAHPIETIAASVRVNDPPTVAFATVRLVLSARTTASGVRTISV